MSSSSSAFILPPPFFLSLFGFFVVGYSIRRGGGKSGASFQPVLSFSLSRDKSISQLCIFFFNFQDERRKTKKKELPTAASTHRQTRTKKLSGSWFAILSLRSVHVLLCLLIAALRFFFPSLF
jgi:hypothetical protein